MPLSLIAGAAASTLLAAAPAAWAQTSQPSPSAETTPRSAVSLSAPAPTDAPVAAGVARPAAATTPDPAAADPWERTNRKLYNFNRGFDRVAIRPGVAFYHHATPTPVRRGVTNVLSNMGHPIIFVNDVLQLRPKNAAKSLARLVINSTVGIGGVFDVAAKAGIPFHASDFGQTMGRYGVPTGAYVFIPVLGPTTVRDGFGRVIDGVIDPFNVVRYDGRTILVPVRTVVNGVNTRDQVDPLLKEIDRTATDPYATTRSLYLQNRRSLVSGKAAPTQTEVDALPDFGPAPAAPPVRSPNRGGSAPS